jgi:hypothetical protein
MDAYLISNRNSLLFAFRSLLFENFSLLFFLGNLVRSRCGTAAFQREVASKGPKIAKFPVNFPVSRELSLETGSYLTAHTTKLFKHLASHATQ